MPFYRKLFQNKLFVENILKLRIFIRKFLKKISFYRNVFQNLCFIYIKTSKTYIFISKVYILLEILQNLSSLKKMEFKFTF